MGDKPGHLWWSISHSVKRAVRAIRYCSRCGIPHPCPDHPARLHEWPTTRGDQQ